MNINSETVLNRTNIQIDSNIEQIRVVETDGGLVIKHHITERERLFSEYSNFAVKTAQSTLEMCRVVFEAKKILSKEEYSKFCNDIGYKSENSTIRKYLVIGEKYSDFITHADLLPSSWTSIYKITQIPSESFDALVMSGNSMATMNGKQIDALKAIGTAQKSVTASKQKSQTSVTPIAPTTSISIDENSNSKNDVGTESDIVSNDNSPQTESTIKCHDDVSVAASEKSDTYEILIIFNNEPSDDDWWNLTEELERIIAKHNLNVDVIEL